MIDVNKLTNVRKLPEYLNKYLEKSVDDFLNSNIK